MKVSTNPQKIKEILERGVAEIINFESAKSKLLSGQKLRIKFGIDPTSKNIHLGRTVPLLKLRALQDLGHTIVLIVGDFTGVIGDTSDKESERPMLTKKEITINMKTYVMQLEKILLPKKLEIHHNSKWLNKLHYDAIGEHADIFSLSDFINRENIKKRLESGERISMREVLYPIMQGYDSIAIRADIEVGGTDQKFNMLAGRKMQEKLKQKPQDIIMLNIISGTDGRKMSSSWGNTINVLDKPEDMFGKIMRLPDIQIIPYFVHCTRLPQEEIQNIEKDLSNDKTNEREVKLKLAKIVTAFYHGEKKGSEAEKDFINIFTNKNAPESLRAIYVEGGTSLLRILREQHLVESNNEWRRLIKDGAVEETISGEKIRDYGIVVQKEGKYKIGKRRFVHIKIKNK